MKTVMVTGSREWPDYEAVRRALAVRFGQGFARLIVGDCRGADAMANKAATLLGMTVEEFQAYWGAEGNAAGPNRNQRMVDARPDLVLAFILPDSRGTIDACTRALRAGIPVMPFIPKPKTTEAA